MMEKIVHTAKQTVKATVESPKARVCSPGLMVVPLFMGRPPFRIAYRLDETNTSGGDILELTLINRSCDRAMLGNAELGL
jgi:hypothetical protein